MHANRSIRPEKLYDTHDNEVTSSYEGSHGVIGFYEYTHVSVVK
jgi:hypothetical protein